MTKQNSPVAGAQETTEEEVATNPAEEAVIPTKEESKDLPLTSQQLREMGVPIDDLEEEKSEESRKDGEGGSSDEAVSEEVRQAPQEDMKNEVGAQEAPRVSSLDRRIARLYQETQVLQGLEAPETAAVLEALNGTPFREREQALHRLLTQRRDLRGDTESPEMDAEDQEALIEAQVEERWQSMQGEIFEKERSEDLISMLEAHPELDARKPEYNQKLEQAVNTLYERGMKVSEAYDLVMQSVTAAKEKQIQTEKKQAEIHKQKALSGVVSATANAPKSDKGMTWEQFDQLRTSDPDRYMKLLQKGFRPSDETKNKQ